MRLINENQDAKSQGDVARQFNVRNFPFCPNKNGTGRQDCQRPSMTILSDHDMSIEFHYEIPFVGQIV